MRRRDFMTTAAGATLGAAALPIGWPLAALAQHGGSVRRVGVLRAAGTAGTLAAPSLLVALRQELARLGWAEGRNLRIDDRFSGGDPGPLAADAEELVNLRPDAILTLGGAAARAVQQRTQVIPIVFLGAGDPLENGLVNSVARPAGNITGFANNFGSEGGKWLELLKEAAPRITRVASLADEAGRPDLPVRAAIDAAAPKLALTIVRITLRSPGEIERDISAFAAEPNGAMLLAGPPPSPAKLEAIERLALQYRLPTMFGGAGVVEDGVLMSHGPDINDLVPGVASYIDRILRGAKVSDLPVQYPTRFKLVVNLKTAKAIGLTIPETFLVRADQVIE
jgi:putative tryptophan/tyrosine transport system substrate-binding protein